MRLLANENFPGDAVDALRQAGHDIVWVRTDTPGVSDEEVLRRARIEKRVLLTFDKDFGDLVFRAGQYVSSGIVLFRISPISPDYVARAVVKALESRSDWTGLFAVVQEDRIRIRSWSEL